jgi:hypothetical protein
MPSFKNTDGTNDTLYPTFHSNPQPPQSPSYKNINALLKGRLFKPHHSSTDTPEVKTNKTFEKSLNSIRELKIQKEQILRNTMKTVVPFGVISFILCSIAICLTNGSPNIALVLFGTAAVTSIPFFISGIKGSYLGAQISKKIEEKENQRRLMQPFKTANITPKK